MKEFKKFELGSYSLSILIGGKKVYTGDSFQNDEGCTVTRSDEFEDIDNDGIWDANESGIICSETKC